MMPGGHTRPNLKLAIAPGLVGVEAGRGEVMALPLLHTHIDHQVAVLHAHILAAVGRVALQLVVA